MPVLIFWYITPSPRTSAIFARLIIQAPGRANTHLVQVSCPLAANATPHLTQADA